MRNSNNFNDTDRTEGGGGGNLIYLLAGCGIGATLALLFAPKAGSELRGDLSEITRKGYDETLELAHQMKDRSADLYQTIKESSNRVYDLAAERLSMAEKTLKEAQPMAGELANGEIGKKTGKPNQQPPSGNNPGSAF
jgi:gas vesicle protein